MAIVVMDVYNKLESKDMDSKYIDRIIDRVEKGLLARQFNYLVREKGVMLDAYPIHKNALLRIIKFGIAEMFSQYAEVGETDLDPELSKIYDDHMFRKLLMSKIEMAASGSRIPKTSLVSTVNRACDVAAFEPSRSKSIRMKQELKLAKIS